MLFTSKSEKKHCNFFSGSLNICAVFNLLQKWIFERRIGWNINNYEFPKVLNCQFRSKEADSKKIFYEECKLLYSWLAVNWFWCTEYWMDSMYWYQCCHTVYFLNMVFFLYSTFCLDVISQNYVIKFRIYHLLCVLLLWWWWWWWWNYNFFLMLTFLYSI